ncbi:MAG: hypothetical protein OWS74_01000, partial [Firmicutes bacterium]|nr:hypothetical protein [Bacillota bacterium]
MVNKSLVFFDEGLAVEVAQPIFSRPIHRRGRRPDRERFFPNGQLKPARTELIQYILDNVLYQVDPDLDGPIFCKHVIKCNRERNRESMYHIVLGAYPWIGVWEVVGNQRMFHIEARYIEAESRWIPQISLS